jgi:PAS domain S-box-containing protein
MHFFALIPLIACVICAGCCLATGETSYDRTSRRNRLWSRMLFACPAAWAFCEVALCLMPDAESGWIFLKLSLLPIVAVGPIGIATTLSLAERPAADFRRQLPPFVIGALVLLAIDWSTNLVMAGVNPVPWGHVVAPGPLFPLLIVLAGLCGAVALTACIRMLRRSPNNRGFLGARLVVIALGLLVTVGTATDGILPLFDIQVPRLATSCFALIALAVLWSGARTSGNIFSTPSIMSQEILRSLNEGVAFVTLDDRVLLANESMATLLGCDTSELIGQRFNHHIPALALDRAQQRIDVHCELVPAAGEPVAVAASISTARDLRGDPLGLVVVLRDLREIELLRSRLVTSDRLAAVGQLAAGIAHEINNPLAFVRTNLGVLQEYWGELEKALAPSGDRETVCPLLEDGEAIIAESIEGVDRAARIVRDVREFSHAGSAERDQTQLNDLLERVIRVATPQLGGAIELQRDYGELPKLLASTPRLEQVFLNLIVNAIQAVGAEGRVRVSTRGEEGAVRVEIADDGCGIEPGDADRIFDPFYTTKPVGEGTGLGLSISHEIIRDHGGEIGVTPGLDGRGCCFTVRLPLDPPDATPAP